MSVGEEAQDFALPDEEGRQVSLSSLKGNYVVLFFYPGDFTPVCTKEACTFRDSFDKFRSSRAVILGISSDSVDSHKKFKEKYNLPFTLLSDPSGKVKAQYKVGGLRNSRKTFVIDPSGKIVHVTGSIFNWKKHVEEALSYCK